MHVLETPNLPVSYECVVKEVSLRIKEMDSKKKDHVNGASFFQMPLHYPRYTKKDYQNMPEWQLDRLLAEYGLPVNGDLAYKREFALGAFLWPDRDLLQEKSRNSSPCYGFERSAYPSNKKYKIVEFLYRVLRFA
ncbi:unnamed protein product [Dovyalis caffra]|uniref:DUF7722 domain-containing protein n=1 Tax=Dovyalis caffra TaxID=77055 RepID=A0AAV1R0G1_9ROSI|nr:unnamed protein product [Dovyalis caffra]